MYDDPYDPDMDVREALRAGLIVAHDSIKTGDTYTIPCGMPIDQSSECTRSLGHKGNHTVLIRYMPLLLTKEEAERYVVWAQSTLNRVRFAVVNTDIYTDETAEVQIDALVEAISFGQSILERLQQQDKLVRAEQVKAGSVDYLELMVDAKAPAASNYDRTNPTWKSEDPIWNKSKGGSRKKKPINPKGQR